MKRDDSAEFLATLERVRWADPSWSNLGDLIKAVSYVCSQVRGMDVSIVQDLLDEASGALEDVYAYTDEERAEMAR